MTVLDTGETAILDCLRSNPGLTATEIGERLGIRGDELNRRIMRLRRTRYLKPAGYRGRWRTWEATSYGVRKK